MASSAVSSVLSLRDATGNRAETRTGAKIYYGDAASFHGWEFRTRPYTAGKSGDQFIEAMSEVCDGLRGDAVIAAQEAGFDNLCEMFDGRQRGIQSLISDTCEKRFLPRLDTSPKDYSASTVVQKDSYPCKMEKVWNSMSRSDDVAGHPDSDGLSNSSQ